MQSYVINLIRHGAVDETLKGKYIGTTNVGLSKKGREDLVTIKETLRDILSLRNYFQVRC